MPAAETARAMGAEHPYGEVERLLSGSAFGQVRYVLQTGSTNEDAATLLGDPHSAGLTIVAERQSRGTGRKGRSWIARPNTALLFTTILPVAMPANDLWAVTFWAALGARSALARNGIDAELRWPNDLLLGGKKLCGILCVSRVAGDRASVACGIGINVTRDPDADDDIVPPPAFCSDLATVDRARLLADVLLAFDATLEHLRAPHHIARTWERAAGIPGARYRLQKDGESEFFEAPAVGLATGGALIVERDGRRDHVALADARALR